jgi:hypothetical protein
LRKRHKIFYLSFLFICYNNIAPGQNTFFKSYAGFSGVSEVEANDGGIVIAGTGANGNNTDVCLMKTTIDGTIEWIKCFGGSLVEFPSCLIRTHDNCYVMAGRTNSFGVGGYDIFVIKTDSMGDTLWTRTYGGTGTDEAEAIVETNDSTLMIAGFSLSFGGSNGGVLILKINGNGDVIWCKLYESSLAGLNAYSINQTNDGGFIIGGSYSNLTIDGDFYLLKIDSAGNYLWDKYYGSSIPWSDSRVFCVKQTFDKGFVIAGKRGLVNSAHGISLFDIFKTDASGNMLWDKSYGDTAAYSIDVGYSIEETYDGGLIAAGIVNSFGSLQMYMQKTDNAGNLIWARGYGNGNFSGECRALQRKDSDFVIIGNLAFNTGYQFNVLGTDKNGVVGCYDSIIPAAIYNNQLTGANALGLATAVNLVAGKPPTIYIINNASAFTACLYNGVNENTSEPTFDIYPNPTNNSFVLKNIFSKGSILIQIRSVLGKIVYSIELSGMNEYLIDANLLNGIYFVCVSVEQRVLVKKLIVE